MRQRVPDSALPSLPVAFDLDVLSSRFERLLEGAPGDRRFALSNCRRVDTSYEPGVRCLATYELTGRRPSGSGARTFGVLDVDPSGAGYRVFPDDPELPELGSAADEKVIGERLATVADLPGRCGSDACAIQPVRYKPGERCVLRYELRSQEKRSVVYGKLLVTGGGRLHATLTALNAARQTAPDMPRVPCPLSYWSDLGLVIQSAETGPTLTASALDDSPPALGAATFMRSAGGAVAALHHEVKVSAPLRTLGDDARELRSYSNLFNRLTADLAPRFHEAIAGVHEHARSNTEPAPVPSHGALRTSQFLVGDDGGLVLLDFDGFCWATPARDIANLLAYLNWRAIRRPDDRALVDQARRAFLEGYSSVAALPESSWLQAFQVASMLKIAGRRLRSLSIEEWDLLAKLLDAAVDTMPR